MILEWKKKSYIELIAVYIHPKNSNHLRSHLRAIMALDHSRLGLENEFLENKSGRIFCVRQVYLTKSCQQIWVRVNQHFILCIHHIWGETAIWGAVFIIQTSDKMKYFKIFQDKLRSFNFQNRTKHAWAFGKTVRKISKIFYTASWFSLLTSVKFSVDIKRVTLQHNKEVIVFFFLFSNGFITMCSLKKRLIYALGILSTPASDVYERLKTNGKAIKIGRDF